MFLMFYILSVYLGIISLAVEVDVIVSGDVAEREHEIRNRIGPKMDLSGILHLTVDSNVSIIFIISLSTRGL
jgi:hypothetical protein